MKTWRELMSDDDAMPLIREWADACPHSIQILDVDEAAGIRALEALQVTTRSALGALAFHTGGLSIDHGWLRILGAGCEAFPRAIDTWNGVGGEERCQHGLLVADDVLGGFFAWFREPRTIHYLAPDSLEWEDLDLGHTNFIAWSLGDGVADFYTDYRWEGWPAYVEQIRADSGLSIVPPLWAEGPALIERSRRSVPIDELWRLQLDFQRQLVGVQGGQRVTLKPVP